MELKTEGFMPVTKHSPLLDVHFKAWEHLHEITTSAHLVLHFYWQLLLPLLCFGVSSSYPCWQQHQVENFSQALDWQEEGGCCYHVAASMKNF